LIAEAASWSRNELPRTTKLHDRTGDTISLDGSEVLDSRSLRLPPTVTPENTMDPFAQTVDGWHDFYMMIGTAAATLMGLLFVSLSLNADVITRKENADLRALAAHTFGSFMSVLMFAVLFLIPSQVPPGLGLPLLGVGAYGLYNTISHLLETRRKPPRIWARGGIARRFAIPLLCFGALMVIAVSVLLGETGGLYWLVPVMILLILAAGRNAWDLLLGLREPPQAS
jgi:hypothetical protein